MVHILIVAGILVCAVMALRAARLLVSALWLAGASALVALLLYLLGAPEIAVIELSVGAGLVTVLFVFAISIAGEEEISNLVSIPKPIAGVLVLVAVLLLGWLALPILNFQAPTVALGNLGSTLWRDRSLDVLLQVIMVFSGVLGVMGLLAEGKPGSSKETQS